MPKLFARGAWKAGLRAPPFLWKTLEPDLGNASAGNAKQAEKQQND
jgi:hypothetical protein